MSMVGAGRQDGAIALEFSLVSGFILLTFIVGLELLRVSYYSLSLQFISNDALRRAVVGVPENPPQHYDHVQAIEDRALTRARSFGIELSPDSITICPVDDSDCATDNAGSSGEFIYVTIRLRTRVLFLADILLTSVSVGRNEPF